MTRREDKKGLKILIIDDDKNIRFTLGMRVESMGYIVNTAENGKEGLTQV
jgi:CheY-like chemotaxis protein